MKKRSKAGACAPRGGHGVPRVDEIVETAQIFNVSCDYLPKDGSAPAAF